MTHSGRPVRGAAIESRSELAQAMIAARLNAGLTQGEIAELIPTSRTTIVRLESGRDLPLVSTLTRWAEVTGKRLEIRFL